MIKKRFEDIVVGDVISVDYVDSKSETGEFKTRTGEVKAILKGGVCFQVETQDGFRNLNVTGEKSATPGFVMLHQ